MPSRQFTSKSAASEHARKLRKIKLKDGSRKYKTVHSPIIHGFKAGRRIWIVLYK